MYGISLSLSDDGNLFHNAEVIEPKGNGGVVHLHSGKRNEIGTMLDMELAIFLPAATTIG